MSIKCLSLLLILVFPSFGYAESVFTVDIQTSDALDGATAFLISPGIVLTNKHVIESLSEDASFSINLKDQKVSQSEKPVCAQHADFCLIRMNTIPFSTPLKISMDRKKIASNVKLSLDGNNLNGEIIRLDGFSAPTQEDGMLYHCISEMPGMSGAPIRNLDGDVEAVNVGSIQYKVAGCKKYHSSDQYTTGIAVSMSDVFLQMQLEMPALYQEVMQYQKSLGTCP